MRKKESRASAKTKEKQLHSLIKVLRPKVYITDSSSFKQLVQELTGYQSQITDIPIEVEKVPVMENIKIAAPAITTTSLDSLESFEQAFQLEEIDEESGLMKTADQDMSMFGHVPLLTSQGHTDIPIEVEKVPVMENIEIAAPAITTTSLDSLESFEQAFQLEETDEESGLMKTADQDMSMFDHVPLLASQGHTDWRAYRNIESWLFDADDHEPYSWYTGSTMTEQEASLFDYELLY